MVKPKAKEKHHYTRQVLPGYNSLHTAANRTTLIDPSHSEEQFSVKAQLEQLRLEHARSRRNVQSETNRRTQLHDIHPFYNYASGTPLPDIRLANPDRSPSARGRVPGPQAPRSWTAATGVKSTAIHEQQSITERIKKKQQMRVGVKSLCEICTYAVAYQIAYKEEHGAQLSKAIKGMPTHLKELLLHAISEIGGMNNRILTMLSATDLTDLCLENCTLSLDLFFRTFWKIETKRAQLPKEVKDTWEELEEDEIDEPTLTITRSDKSDDSRFANLFRIARLINSAVDLSRRWTIATKLTNLSTLDISFFRPHLPGLATCELIVTTLPQLISLSMANTLQKEDGYGALSVLSKGLRMLQFWDIGYHDWITPEVICGYSSVFVINWDRDLQNLEFLSLEHISSDTDTDTTAAMTVKRQFYEDVQLHGRAKRRPIVLTNSNHYHVYN
jgi:hypothetical protein